jgi:hypothetical protein
MNELENELTNMKTYALVVDGEFACVLKMPSLGHPKIEMISAALGSNPVVLDMTNTDFPDDGNGWVWNGSQLEKQV